MSIKDKFIEGLYKLRIVPGAQETDKTSMTSEQQNLPNQIQEAIDNLKKEYTILIIAHRFSTIINSDRIYYIEDGKVLDYGTHKELLKKCKQYKNLYESELKNNK